MEPQLDCKQFADTILNLMGAKQILEISRRIDTNLLEEDELTQIQEIENAKLKAIHAVQTEKQKEKQDVQRKLKGIFFKLKRLFTKH